MSVRAHWMAGDEGYVYRKNRWVKVSILQVKGARLQVEIRTNNGVTKSWMDADKVWRQDHLFEQA